MNKFRSQFLPLLALLFIVVVSAPLNRAQTNTATRVMSDPDGPWFYVDNTLFYHAQAFFWPAGSLHTLWAPAGSGYAYNPDQTIQWKFQGWQWSGGQLSGNPVQVVADPSIPQYTAVYTTQFLLTVQTACDPAPCTGNPGTVQQAGAVINGSQSTWQAPNSTIMLQAFANPGWTFEGWQSTGVQNTTGFQDIVSVAGPTTVTAIFAPTVTVNFATTPPNLQVYGDRTLLTTPTSLQWGQGTTHALAGLDVQLDINGKRWIFSNWSDGGSQQHNFTVPKKLTPITLTAVHTPAAYPYFFTSPPNLNLNVDNQMLPPPYQYIWGVGTTHQITAPATQTDGQGNTWNFKSWDDLVSTPTRTITIPAGADVDGYRLTALYTQATQAHLTVASTLPGLSVMVDGSACTTPCNIARDMGTKVRVSAPVSIPLTTGSRQDMLGWSTNGGAPVAGDWVGTLNSANTTISASYHQMNSLTASASPAGGASWSISPSSTDGFYDSQTSVNIGVAARPGYRFSGWSGDLSGSAPNAVLSMSAPHSVVAQFTTAPFIGATGVSNAAGAVPQTGVAPGSVASIFGANLAPSIAVGPMNPMVQTLGGVTARIGDQLLPLYFASPEQINLQIPPDMPVGSQTITISAAGQADVSTKFNIVRNAPGLFSYVLDGQVYALVLHQDGTLVTPNAPALRGETLTAYVTGLGKTTPARPEGIPVPLTPAYAANDPVTLQVGSVVFTPQSSVAAPGQVGLDLITFQLDDTAPSGGTIAVYLTVNGVNSNTVSLPIQ